MVKDNIEKMLKILKRDFSENQIIIASVFKYEFEDINIIQLNECLIDELISY